MFFVWKMLRTILNILAGTVIVVGLGFFSIGVLWMLILAVAALGGPMHISLAIPSGQNFFLAGIFIILGLIPVSIVVAYDEN